LISSIRKSKLPIWLCSVVLRNSSLIVQVENVNVFCTWRMPSSGMLRCMTFVWTNVLEELSSPSSGWQESVN
jgi:hypothetical protein